ncbi:MAG TPA: hypothetical protein VMT03_09815 [Polyangia bacterium]|nr:hypothetical protein [Polyangia bacterium]
MSRSRVWGPLCALALAGCGGRSSFWSAPVGSPLTFSLGSELAVVDTSADRVVVLTPGADQTLTTTAVPVGVDILNAATSPDGKKLFVVSGGHRAQLGDPLPTEPPSITVITDGVAEPQRYDLKELTEPLAGLAIDPGGQWVVLYPGTGSSQPYVENPNELLVVDVSKAPGVVPPVVHTLMSFGGHPQRFTFTPPLALPIGVHPLLIVESDQDLSLLQLDDMSQPPEITVPLTNGSDTRLLAPAGLVVYPGDASSGAMVGVRLANDTDVVTLQFVPNVDASGNPVGNGFLPTINLNDVGGTASDIAFVRTDSGLRLAALVPTRTKATLIDPVTNLTTDVALPAGYQNLSVVTNALGTPSGCSTAAASPSAPTDVALLWNGASGQAQTAQSGVAFWALGQAGCQPYRSIDTVGVSDSVAQVLDVPTPNQTLKVLQTRQAAAFCILNLPNRTAQPLETINDGFALAVSPLGDQVWTFIPGGLTVVGTDFANELPRSLLIERAVSGVYELSRPAGSNPAVVVLHDQGGLGATVYDAVTLADSTRRLYSGLLLGDAP